MREPGCGCMLDIIILFVASALLLIGSIWGGLAHAVHF